MIIIKEMDEVIVETKTDSRYFFSDSCFAAERKVLIFSIKTVC